MKSKERVIGPGEMPVSVDSWMLLPHMITSNNSVGEFKLRILKSRKETSKKIL